MDAREANPYAYAAGDPVNLADPSGQGIGDIVEDLGRALGVVETRVAPVCYTYNALKDEEDDWRDELYDLNQCFNPLSWLD